MQSSLIGKIEKARLYAREPERVQLHEFQTTFRGEHDSYDVAYRGGAWQCTCHFFPAWRRLLRLGQQTAAEGDGQENSGRDQRIHQGRRLRSSFPAHPR